MKGAGRNGVNAKEEKLLKEMKKIGGNREY